MKLFSHTYIATKPFINIFENYHHIYYKKFNKFLQKIAEHIFCLYSDTVKVNMKCTQLNYCFRAKCKNTILQAIIHADHFYYRLWKIHSSHWMKSIRSHLESQCIDKMLDLVKSQ